MKKFRLGPVDGEHPLSLGGRDGGYYKDFGAGSDGTYRAILSETIGGYHILDSDVHRRLDPTDGE